MTAEPSLRRAGGIGSGALGRQPDSLADVLERVLDKGIVIVGDVVINVLDLELLTLKLRLFVSSAETAREMGLDWWTHDPFFSSRAPEAVEDVHDDVAHDHDALVEDPFQDVGQRVGLAAERARADPAGAPERRFGGHVGSTAPRLNRRRRS